MKRAIVTLTLLVCMMPGCAQVQKGVNWVFFPNETAAREAWEAERIGLDSQRTRLVDELEKVAEEQRTKVSELARRRVDIDRAFQKATVDYNADIAVLEIEEQTAVTSAKQLLDSIETKLSNLGDLYTQREAAFENRLRAASSQDTLLWSVLTGALGLAGGGGLVAARATTKIRERVAEARDEQGQISEAKAFGVVWESVEAIKEASPEFKQAWDNHPEWGEVAKKVLQAAGDQYVLLAESKKLERKDVA